MTHFAESLKTLRQKLDLTMQDLADKAQVSKSMICKIERDEVQPTLDVASRLARSLGKTLSEMLHTPQSTQMVFLPRDQQAVWEDASQIKRRNISPVFEGLKIEWLEVEFPPGASVGNCPILKPGTEKYVLVTEGRLDVDINQQTFHLHKGDSLYFDASCPHGFFNRGEEIIKYYVLVKYKD